MFASILQRTIFIWSELQKKEKKKNQNSAPCYLFKKYFKKIVWNHPLNLDKTVACCQDGGGRCDLEIFPLHESYDVTGSESAELKRCLLGVPAVFSQQTKKNQPSPPACQFEVSGSAFAELLRSFAFSFSRSALWVVLHRFCLTLTWSTCLCGLHLTHGASMGHHLCHQTRGDS